ncbi:neuron navigator 2-like isoform X4 [Centruroides vittatus]|uniref:neuron navigator 2-like isoform X4 n=1 Tax=Centruroides vittatus TaxID=120091 RepID=UPI00350EBF48
MTPVLTGSNFLPSLPSIYMEWANHYLERGHYKRCVQDLQNDVRDGVLLADVIEAVIGVKIPNIVRKPQNAEEMVNNIEFCLALLVDLGVSTQNITSKDIKDGNLKSILSLFFNLSRYKQAQKENSATSNSIKENKIKRPNINCTSEMPSKLPAPFKPASRESSPASISHIPAPTSGNTRKLSQIERPQIKTTTNTTGTSGAACKPPQSSNCNSRPASFIPQPRGQRDRAATTLRPPTSSNSIQSGKQIPAANKTSSGENKVSHNSMFDKFKLFNSKDKAGTKANPVSKRTSSSSGISSAQSERSDSSTSLCTDNKTAAGNNVRPNVRNGPKKNTVVKTAVAPSKATTSQVTKSEPKKQESQLTTDEKQKLQQSRKSFNIKKSAPIEEKSNKPGEVNKVETNASRDQDDGNEKETKSNTSDALHKDISSSCLDNNKSSISQPNNSIHLSKFAPAIQHCTASHQSKVSTNQSVGAQSKTPHNKEGSEQNDKKCTQDKTDPPSKTCETHPVINSATMSTAGSHLPKPTAAVKGTSKTPSKLQNNQDIYVPVHISAPEIQPEVKLNKSCPRNESISVAMVSPILNSKNDSLKLETAFDNTDKIISSSNKMNETTLAEEAEDIVLNIKPMQPIIRSSAYGYMRSLSPLTGRLRFQTELNGGRIGFGKQIFSDTNRVYNMKKSILGGGGLLEADYLSDLDHVDLSAGYMSDGEILRPGAICHLDDIASGYLSEGGSQPLYTKRNTNRSKDLNGSQQTGIFHDERNKSSMQNSIKFGFEDSSSLSSGISDTVAEFSTDDITSSSMSSDNQFNSLKRTPHTQTTCKLSLPSSNDKNHLGSKSINGTNDSGSKNRSNIKKTDSSMQTESSAFHHNSTSTAWKKHHDQTNRLENKCESEKCKIENEKREKKGTSSSSSKKNASSDSHKSRHKSSKSDESKHKGAETDCPNEKSSRSNKNICNDTGHLKNNDGKKVLSSRAATPNVASVTKRSTVVHPSNPCSNMKSNSTKLSIGNPNCKKILEKCSDNLRMCDSVETTNDPPSIMMFQRCGTVPGCSNSRASLDIKGKLKVSANTQTTVHDLCVTTHSDSEYSSLGRKYPTKHYLLASPAGLKDRVYGNRSNNSSSVSDYVLLPGLSGGEHRTRFSMKSTDSDNYLRLDIPTTTTSSTSHYAWLRHSPSLAMSVASAPTSRLYSSGVLTEAESMESLSSTTSSVHAQIQHARANSLTHARLMMHQRELSSSPRLSRSNSIRSTKSEKLYPSMLQRSDDLDSAIGCSASLSGYSGNGSGSSHTSQPTSPISLTQGCARLFPLSHMNPAVTTSNPTQTNSRSSNTMSHYMGGLLSKIGNKDDDIHGSSLSLVSTTSSIYSTAEEKQAHEIKKLKRELEQAHEKVTTLTSQLTTNAHMVAAFEQSLSNMTTRLQHLTATAEQKDSELNELRSTIEALKKQSAEAGLTKMALQSMQAVQRSTGVPNLVRRHTFNTTKDTALQESRISRQFSTESMSSANSLSSTSIKNAESNSAKKKKKKSWFKSSFSRAFSRSKKNKNGSVSDVEDTRQFQSDSSTPNSPLLGSCHHLSNGNIAQSLKLSHSSSAIYDKDDEPAPEIVVELKKQLREKDLVLTDIRLEALTSAHQLEGLKDTVNKMRAEMMNLKQDNDRLQQIVSSKSLASSQGSLENNAENIEKRLSGQIDPSIIDLQAKDNHDGKRITISVFLGSHGDYVKYISHTKETLIGSIFVSNKTKWDLLDSMVKQAFKEYIFQIDPVSTLGLSSESIHSYHIGEITRSKDNNLPELLPCGYFVGDNAQIHIVLKGAKQNSVDALVFEMLIPKLIVHRYVSLLTDHRRIILCGPSGTGKTYIAQKLAEYLVLKNGKEMTAGAVATFSVDHKSAKELRQYLSNIAEQCESSNAGDLPSVIILDNLHHVGSLAEVFNGFLSAKYQKCPYIIGTMNQATCSTTNLQLHHNFRWVLCANHMEPVKGFLGRYLRKRLIEEEVQKGKTNEDLTKVIEWMPKVWQHLNKFLETHSSSDVTIGPRLFLSCPIDISNSQVWFTDLWNYSIVPYLLEAVREGLQLYGRRAPWEDPADWVHMTYPWPPPSAGEWPQLLRLRPEDVGYDSHLGSGLGNKHLHSNPSEVEGDPLLNMLMRLQEAATYSSPLSNDNECTRLDNKIHKEELISGGLESTL